MCNTYIDGSYLRRHPLWHVADSPWKAAQVLKLLRVNNIKPSTVGEIGCGAGELLMQLAQKLDPEVSFHGYEMSPQAFALCHERTRTNIHFYNDSMFTASSEYYDVVLVIDVVEHVEDCFSFLKLCRHMGMFKLFHFPLDLHLRSVVRDDLLLRSRKTDGHLHYFTKALALALLQDTGYTVIDHLYTNKATAPGHRRSRLLKWPRAWLFSQNRDLAVRLLGGWGLVVLAK